MQQERVEDQYPWTWEIPLAVVCAIIVLGVAVSQLGRSFANWFAGAGWRWPAADQLVTSLPGVLAGDAAAGLNGVHPAADPGVLWASLGVTGLLATILLAVTGVWAWHRWGPVRMRGMATVAGAHQLLGKDRLWKARHVVRPDLFPSGRRVSR